MLKVQIVPMRELVIVEPLPRALSRRYLQCWLAGPRYAYQSFTLSLN